MIRRMLACLLGAGFLQGCLHVPASGDRIYDGVWVSADANIGNVILRNPDGTFEEKKTQRYDFSKPPITYTAGGLWRVSKGRYILTYRRISTDVFASESRKSFEMSVIDVGSGKFRYVSTDGAVVEEIRVGTFNLELYDRTPIPLFGTELPQGIGNESSEK